MNTAAQPASSQTTAIFLRYLAPAYLAVDAALNGWNRTGELRLLYSFQAVAAIITLAVRRFSLEHSRYCLGYAAGAEAAARALLVLQAPQPLNQAKGIFLALTVLVPATVLLFDAWVLRMLSRPPEPAG